MKEMLTTTGMVKIAGPMGVEPAVQLFERALSDERRRSSSVETAVSSA